MKLTAKHINENFWIVQRSGRKIGAITVTATGVEYHRGTVTEKFTALDEFSQKYPVEFVKYAVTKPPTHEVMGYPTRTTAHNSEFNVQHQLPVYTADEQSRCKLCAGHYIVRNNKGQWQRMWCPKFIRLQRCAYYGPFKTLAEVAQCWDQIHADTSTDSTV
jgi:hypothetical protein